MVFVPGSVTDVVAFVFNSPVLAYMGVEVGGTGVFGGAAGDNEGELFAEGYSIRPRTSRRMQPSWAAWGNSIPVASVVQVDHRLIRP